MKAVIDRMEEGKAVLVFDDGQQLNVSGSELPPGAGEGSVLELHFNLDREEEAARRKRVSDLIGRLVGKNKD